MCLEREDGTPWFKALWSRGGRKRFSQADAANLIYERTLRDARLAAQFEADRKAALWNSPCTPPDEPGVYEVMAGVDLVLVGWTKAGQQPRSPIRHQEPVVMLAHWNGVRWGSAVPPLYGRNEPGRRFSDRKLVEVGRRFNPRQDYPWREVPA